MTNPHDDPLLARLSEYLDGELDPAEHEALQRHLETCDDCRQSLHGLHAVVARLRREGSVAAGPRSDADALWPRVASRLVAPRTERSPAYEPASSRWALHALVAGLAFLLGIGGGAWYGRAKCYGAFGWTMPGWSPLAMGPRALRLAPSHVAPRAPARLNTDTTHLPSRSTP